MDSGNLKRENRGILGSGWRCNINPSTGRYFPLKYLFRTCLKINHSHTTLFMSMCSQERERERGGGGDMALHVQAASQDWAAVSPVWPCMCRQHHRTGLPCHLYGPACAGSITGLGCHVTCMALHVQAASQDWAAVSPVWPCMCRQHHRTGLPCHLYGPACAQDWAAVSPVWPCMCRQHHRTGLPCHLYGPACAGSITGLGWAGLYYFKYLANLCNISVEERLDLVEIFFSDLSLRCTVRDCLKIVPDYFRLAKKLNKGKGSLQVCVCQETEQREGFSSGMGLPRN